MSLLNSVGGMGSVGRVASLFSVIFSHTVLQRFNSIYCKLRSFIFHYFHEKTFFKKIKRSNQYVKSYNIRNPVKLFVENPIELFIYSVIIGNK